MTATPRSRPFATTAGDGNRFWFLGQALEIKAAAAQTGGAYAVTDATAAPGFGPGPHIHHREDEAVFVLSGELEFTVDGEELCAPAGTLVHVPRGTLHSWTNVTAGPARLLTLYTPAGFEGIFGALGERIIDQAMPPTAPLALAKLRRHGHDWGLEIPQPE